MRNRLFAVLSALCLIAGVMLFSGASQAKLTGRFTFNQPPGRPQLSGVADPSIQGADVGTASAGQANRSTGAASSDDIQVNADNKYDPAQQFGSGEGWPQNETSIAVNPTDPSNVIGGANDYEPADDTIQGIYTSMNGGKTWLYSRHARQVITPDRQMYGSGDPVIAFDGEGTAYAAFIAFGRANCDSYIAVIRSTDKGVTWSTPVDSVPEGSGLQLGDGIVVHNEGPEDCQIFHDKEWMAAGPRPEGVPLVEGTDPDHVSSDRLYVTWTRFDSGPAGDTFVESPIYVAYSDDQGRHWSAPQEISGASEELCTFQFGDQDGACDEDQYSVPVVDPQTGAVYVAFENFNVESTEFNQYLLVRSFDGGQTWEGPFFVTDVADGIDKYPICEGSQTLDLMCARVNAAGNIDIDPVNGTLYLAWADNRNGTAEDTNTDVFVTQSADGGESWSDPSQVTQSVDDQFFPWLSVTPNRKVAVAYFDRQYTPPKFIDTSLSVSRRGQEWTTVRVSEVSWNPDLAFRLGVFIGDYNGLDTTARTAIPFWTDARFAEPNVEGNNPPNQQSDVMVDVEALP